MLGLERNAKAVGLACYAPMLANVDYVNWKPDMLWFDNHRIYGSPDYYVQKLFMNHQGSRRLEIYTEGLEAPGIEEEPICGGIRLQGYHSEVIFRDVVLENSKTGEKVSFGDYHLKKEEASVWLADTEWKDYTISCRAEELDGFQGFQIFLDGRMKIIITAGRWEAGRIMIFCSAEG